MTRLSEKDLSRVEFIAGTNGADHILSLVEEVREYRNQLRPGIYRHYAGHHYQVFFIARQTETDEELVIYMPLYEHPKGGRVPQARPLKMWLEEVEIGPNEKVPRFTYVGEKLPAKL